MAATNSTSRAEPSDENLYNHLELFNRQSIQGEAPAAIQTYQEEAANQTYVGNDRTVATNNAFRAEPNDEHIYNHIDLFNRQSRPSGAPAANQTYQKEAAYETYGENAIPQEATKIIARSRRERSFAMIAVLVLSFLAMVAASICLAMMMISIDDRVDSGWSSWGPWAPCSVRCGGGNQNRIRDCTNSPPSKGENACLGLSMESQACNPQNCSLRWRKVNKLPVCFEAKGNHFGRFYVPEGRLAAIKMVHLYGYVSCHVHNQYFWSYWGCGDSPASRELVDKVNAVITDSSNNILLPPLQFQTSSNLKWYRVPGYNSLSPELVLPSFSSPEKVHSNQELRVWFGENLVNITEGDNGGTVCADVYALFV